MSRKGLEMSLAQVQAHQARHGFGVGPVSSAAGRVNGASPGSGSGGEAPGASKHPKRTRKDRMTQPEREMALILEAKKRRGEIIEWRFEGISLAWGVDPVTGKQMWYSSDFWVYRNPTFEDSEHLFERLPITLIETKGARLFNAQLVRFRGCRACWPQFNFELHQLANGTWCRVE